MPEIEIQVGRGLRDAAAEIADAWKAAEAGRPRPATDRVYVSDWATLRAVLTPERHDLLRHLRRSPADSVDTLARSLGRTPDAVRADVQALGHLGLVVRADDGGLSSPFDAITSTIHIAA